MLVIVDRPRNYVILRDKTIALPNSGLPSPDQDAFEIL